MATLEKIRNKAGLLVTIVGLALFAFIIGDLLNSSSSFINRNQNHVLEVNGEAVDYQEYNSRETELTEVYKMLMGQPNMSDAYMARIRDDVYNEIVLDKVLAPRLESLGITVTDDEMLDMTQGENLSPLIPQFLPFLQNQETGQFDRNALANFLYQLKTMDQYPPEQKEQLKTYMGLWLFCEKNIKRNRLNEKYTALLSKAVAVNSLEAKDAFESKKESSDIVFTMKSFAGIPDSTIQVSQAEIEKLYNERKEMFRQLETVIIDYIAVDIVPSQEDYDKAQKEMNEIRAELETTDNVAALTNEKSDRKYVNAFFSRNSFASDPDLTSYVETAAVGAIEGPIFKDNTYRLLKLVDKTVAPDSVHVFVLSLAPRATEAETRIYADSLLATIKTDDDFNAAIQAHSVDQFKEKGGEFGWLTEAAALQALNEEFKQTVFSLPKGRCGVVKSTYGLLIAKVADRTRDVEKFKVADITYTVTPSSATRSRTYNALNQFVVKNNTVELMEKSAKESGYEIVENARVVSTDMTLGAINNARQVVRWAFQSKKDNISEEIFECDNKFIVAANKGRLREGYQSVASATPQLKSELIARKKGEILAAELKSKNLSSLDAYAADFDAKVDTVRFVKFGEGRLMNIGNEPKLNALIAAAPLNKLSEPIAGSNGVYVFEVINRSFDGTAYDPKREISMLEMNNMYRIGSMALMTLQRKAEIKDNRINFY